MSTPVEDLQKAWEELVNYRRQWVSVLARSYQRVKTEEAMEKMIQVQRAIEVVEAALAGERRSAAADQTLKEFSANDPFGGEQPGG